MIYDVTVQPLDGAPVTHRVTADSEEMAVERAILTGLAGWVDADILAVELVET